MQAHCRRHSEPQAGAVLVFSHSHTPRVFSSFFVFISTPLTRNRDVYLEHFINMATENLQRFEPGVDEIRLPMFQRVPGMSGQHHGQMLEEGNKKSSAATNALGPGAKVDAGADMTKAGALAGKKKAVRRTLPIAAQAQLLGKIFVQLTDPPSDILARAATHRVVRTTFAAALKRWDLLAALPVSINCTSADGGGDGSFPRATLSTLRKRLQQV